LGQKKKQPQANWTGVLRKKNKEGFSPHGSVPDMGVYMEKRAQKNTFMVEYLIIKSSI
jgi:hypothetical protein